MKEAAGEANMTVITIVLIAIVLAVGTVVVNGIMGNVKRKSCCESMGGKLSGKNCVVGETTYSATGTGTYAQCLKGE